ncbi:hypothetical protein Tco_0854983 [Tanacetum coccineum]
MMSGIEECPHGPSDALHNPSQQFKFLSKGIRHVYDEDPKAEVQFTTECNIFATGQQYIEQPEIITEGRVDQYTEQCQVKRSMLDSSLDNKTTEFLNQSLESENICLKKTVAKFQKDFSRMEAHCIALELKYQNQSSKLGQHG